MPGVWRLRFWSPSFGERAARRDAVEFCFEPSLHRHDERQRPDAPCGAPSVGGLPTDGGLDHVKLGDAPQGFGCNWRAGRFVHLVELAPHVSPAGCELDVAAVAEPIEAGIAG